MLCFFCLFQIVICRWVGESHIGKFWSSFFKSSRRGTQSLTESAFLFVSDLAERGNFLCAFFCQRKSGNQLCKYSRLQTYIQGEPPLVCSPLWAPPKFTLRGACERIGRFALCGGRPPLRAVDERSLFEKSDAKTFNQPHRQTPIYTI